MKLDKSLSGMEWENIFSFIGEQTNDGLFSVLIFRTDEPKRVGHMRDYIKNNPEYIYVRLGIVCSMGKIYQELFGQLKCDPKRLRSAHDEIIPVVVEKITEMESKDLTIVIDNCQYLVFNQLPTLIGLMLELSGIARFIFILPEYYTEQWMRSSNKMKNLFLNLISFQYEII